MGNYFCFDSPGALRGMFKKHFNGKAEDFEYLFSMMYTLYSFPNIILPLIGGILILKFGNRIIYILCAFLIMLGQLIFVIGVTKKNPLLSLLGRTIFGLGGETINTTQSALIIAWFPTNQVTFAFGISLSFFRFSAVLNDIFSPKIATATSLATSLWIGFTICSISFILTLILIYFDWRETLKMKMKEITEEDEAICDKDSQINEGTSITTACTLNNVSFIDYFKF